MKKTKNLKQAVKCESDLCPPKIVCDVGVIWFCWVQWEDGDMLHSSTGNPHYSFICSLINFICILYFNIYFKTYSLKLTVLHLCIGFSYI